MQKINEGGYETILTVVLHTYEPSEKNGHWNSESHSIRSQSDVHCKHSVRRQYGKQAFVKTVNKKINIKHIAVSFTIFYVKRKVKVSRVRPRWP